MRYSKRHNFRSRDEAVVLVCIHLGVLHKTLGFDRKRGVNHFDVLLGKYNVLFPFYIAVACEEFIIHPRIKNITARIESMNGNIPGLFGEVLERLEKEQGEPLVRRALSLIELSVNGLYESEIRGLLAPTCEERIVPQAWARLRRSIGDYLKDTGQADEGLVDISHHQFSDAIRKRYGLDAESTLYGDLARFGFTKLQKEWERESYTPKGTARDCGIYALRVKNFELLQEIWAGTFKIEDVTSNSNLEIVLEVSILEAPEGPQTENWQQFLKGFIGSPQLHLVASFLKTNGDSFEEAGRSSWAELLFRISGECYAILAAQNPDNTRWQRNLGIIYNHIGGILKAKSHLEGALAEFHKFLEISGQLTALDPENVLWQSDLAVSHSNIGAILEARGDLVGALAEFRIALEICERVATQDLDNLECQRDLGASHRSIGGIFEERGDLAGALAEYGKDYEISEWLATLDPDNAEWQSDLAVSHNRIGGILEEQGDLAGALDEFRKALEICERLVALDPDNASWRRDLGVSHSRVGLVLDAQSDLEGALAEYRKDLEISKRLAVLDPKNAGWQSDLAVSHSRIGDILEAQGDLSGANTEFLRSLEISEWLAALDPENSRWQHDLRGCHRNIGGILEEQGDLAGALDEFRKALEICERLVALDPDNAEWQLDLAVGHIRIGDILEAQGDPDSALGEYRQDLNIIRQLAEWDPENLDWQDYLGDSHNIIGVILEAQGDLAGALAEYRMDVEIRARLAAQDPDNALWQRDFGVTQALLGMFLLSSGKAEESQVLLTHALEAIRKIANENIPSSLFDQVIVMAFLAEAEEALGHLDVAGVLDRNLADFPWDPYGVNEPFHVNAFPHVAKRLAAVFPMCPPEQQAGIAEHCLTVLAKQSSGELGPWLERGREALGRLPRDAVERGKSLNALIAVHEGKTRAKSVRYD
jgi:tetratricopeptide (TPR) repeat protein